MSADDAAQFLAASPDRRRLLVALAEDDATPAALADSLALPRRSVQRHLGQLVDRGWAEKVDGSYHLTGTGELTIETHRDYLDLIERIESFAPFLSHLPDREDSPDPSLLEGATLSRATEEHPQEAVNFYIERVQTFETDRIRMLSPVLSRLFHDAHAKLGFDGVHTELVLSSAMIDRARELNPMEFQIVVSVDVLDLYRYPDDIRFGLTIGDNRLLMGAYDDAGQLQACVESMNDTFLAWADERFQSYREAATPVDPPLSLPFKLGR